MCEVLVAVQIFSPTRRFGKPIHDKNVKNKTAGRSESTMRPVNMPEILIVSSQDKQALPWVKYFQECFEKCNIQRGRPCPKFHHLGLEDMKSPEITSELQSKITNVKLQLIIICPTFLELLEEHPEVYSTLGRLFNPDRVIAMLLGVTDESLTEVHHSVLANYSQWQRHVAGEDQDENFVRNFLAAAFNIQAKVAKMEQMEIIEARTSFSVMPRKVKKSQNRLIILLVDPLTPDDKTKVTVNKNGELIEIKNVKRSNPYTLKFSMPECCLEMSLMVNVLVEKNGDLLGMRPVKCESRLRELDQILRTSANPLEFMCQSLGFSPTNKEQLDNFLVRNFQKNLPPNFHLLASKNDFIDNPHKNLHNQEEFPTTLHFAAKYGLEKLAMQLVECPGADMAVDIKNISDMTPLDMAEKNGHIELASILNGYMKMNEFTQIYSTLNYMAQMSEKTNDGIDLDETDYLEPRKFDSPYLIPPPARPVEQFNQPIGYIDMMPQGHRGPSSNKGTLTKNKSNDSGFNSSTNSLPKNDAAQTKSYEDRAQKELSEILTDFKHDIHTVPEVEKLVNIWRNSSNVIESFAVKHEQLKMMQEEYDKIQKKLKEKKGASPFDRFKKLFQRSKRPEMIQKEETNAVIPVDVQSSLKRISNLSLQSTGSSGSSGRMSTLSGFSVCSVVSFGDSGTHSDNEERKQRQSSLANDHDYFEIGEKQEMGNYMVPPAPKPVKFPKPIIAQQQFGTIDKRPPHPVPREESNNYNDQYYIQFPPSGLPVNPTDFQKQKPTTPEPLPPPPDLPADYLQMERETVAADYMNYSLPQQSTENQITNVKNQSDEENIDDFDDDPVDYINTEEFTEYMNIKQLPEYMNSGELPEYMNYDPMKNQVPNI